jgi:hypothetical protein
MSLPKIPVRPPNSTAICRKINDLFMIDESAM